MINCSPELTAAGMISELPMPTCSSIRDLLCKSYEGIKIARPLAAFAPKGEYALVGICGQQARPIDQIFEIDFLEVLKGIEWVAIPRARLEYLRRSAVRVVR